MSGLARTVVVALCALGLAAAIGFHGRAPRALPPSAPTATFFDAHLVRWRGARRVAEGSAATLVLSRADGRFSTSAAEFELPGEVHLRVEGAAGTLVPPFAEFEGLHAASDASFVDTRSLRYDRDAVLRSRSTILAEARLGGSAVRYQAQGLEWDPVSGRIVLEGVETIVASDGGEQLSIRAERAAIDDLWLRARYFKATLISDQQRRSCERLTVDQPHVVDGLTSRLRCD